MPWSVERADHSLNVFITAPMAGEWEALLEDVRGKLDPSPLAIFVPSTIDGGSSTDADLLRLFCAAVGSLDIPIVPRS
jgi:hypothetical protein